MRLDKVLDFNRENGGLKITMEYIGMNLSVNHYKYNGIYTKPEVKKWMGQLAMVIRMQTQTMSLKPPIKVIVNGFFKDKRSQPDLDNLFKVICDSLEDGLGINDREFKIQAGDVVLGVETPLLEIIIEATS